MGRAPFRGAWLCTGGVCVLRIPPATGRPRCGAAVTGGVTRRVTDCAVTRL